MLSFLFPKNVIICQSPGYIKIEGPFGSCIKKTGAITFNLIKTAEGFRLFSSKDSAIVLSILYRLSQGLAYGVRSRMRLRGIGFRATIRDIAFESTTNQSSFYIKTIYINGYSNQ